GFFPDKSEIGQLLEDKTGNTPPHLALFIAFLKLYKIPQEVINRITGRHLDFYFKDVLRLTKKPAVPDKAHLLIELKKNALPISIGTENPFSAGKDKTGVELIYTPTRDTVINTAGVSSIRSIFLDSRGYGTVRQAPVANSADGLGGEIKDGSGWYGFRYEQLPAAEVGFAIASPVLRMKEGTRKITTTITLNNVDQTKLNTAVLNGTFDVFITGEKNWMGPYSISPMLNTGNVLQFDFTVPESEKAIVDYNAVIHGYSYIAQSPVIQVLLRADRAGIGYNNFRNITVKKAIVKVEVSNITSISLESDAGTLDPKKAFLPFGPQPAIGSCFMAGYAEALSKKLSEVTIKVKWKGAPSDLSNYYKDYGVSGVTNSYFTAAVSFKDSGSLRYSSTGVQLFESGNASNEHTLTLTAGTSSVSPAISEGMKVYSLNTSGSLWAMSAANKYLLKKPVFMSFKTTVPVPSEAAETKEGFITLSLEKDFLHAVYRKKYVENVMTYSKTGGTLTILNEPYTPTIQGISLSYKAHSDEVNIGSVSLDDFSNMDIHFFHISCFGQMREHGFQRQQFSFITDKNIPLLPSYSNEGELMVGFKDLKAGDSVSVLFQVAEGSNVPDMGQEDIRWAVLCDNYWRPLGTSEVVLDTTNQLRTSGIVTFIVPAEATAINTLMPSGMIWIKGGVPKNSNAICRLIEVAANAIEVEFKDNKNDPNHLLTGLENGMITKLKNGLPAIKSVKQPYASFGGRPVESDEAFNTRTSERLRHKKRCITAWDYERSILEAFNRVHKVKCIPHAKEGCYLAPGNVLIVVVPDLRNKNYSNPLQPKVDSDTISRITAYVEKHAGMQVKVKVKNPFYQKVQLDFKVRFYDKYEFNYYSEQLRQALIQFLSPWAFEAGRDISFGGKVYKSVV
ncbi:MAG: baseplate J/gp47 family protein, partial [Nitrospira sp.]|nr:baseplate J/gp47 family protein [Nitrospira sp.]